MLVLSRKVGESIIIETPNGQVEIMVVLIDRAKVRIGIEAPKEIKVIRKELGKYVNPND